MKLTTEAIEAIGWAYADCCTTLDAGKDPRQTEMSSVLKRAEIDLTIPPYDKNKYRLLAREELLKVGDKRWEDPAGGWVTYARLVDYRQQSPYVYIRPIANKDETPRTDKRWGLSGYEHLSIRDRPGAMRQDWRTDFARMLERELNEANATIQALKEGGE